MPSPATGDEPTSRLDKPQAQVTHRTGNARPATWLDAIARQGEETQREVESDIECRSASSYTAVGLLLIDLRLVVERTGLPEKSRPLVALDR
jgi:hypothetical protein